MDRDVEQQSFKFTLHERTYQDVMAWLEDSDGDLLPQLSSTATMQQIANRTITLPAHKWVEVCEGLYSHASEFSGTWGRSADSLARQIAGRGYGYFLNGVWIDDAACEAVSASSSV